ncbi:helix-turn-helix domain-containing protein [Vogesella indigofera]|nr:helix-turn-helix domain-containing protein [Vogesella indigofera]
MKNKSKTPQKTATKKPQKSTADMSQSEYRAAYERRVRFQTFKVLAFGMSPAELCAMLDVSAATIRRWKAGTFQPPFMALELLRLRRGLSLPAAFGDLAGFTVGRINGQTYLIPPGLHWSEGITASDIKRWPVMRHIVARTIGKKPALAGLAYSDRLAANDDSLPVEPLTLESLNDQAANDGGCYGDQ